MATNLQTIQKNGLLAELAYLKLEDSRFKGSISNAGDIKSFLNTVELEEDETYDEATGISLDRKDAILSLLDKYQIVGFGNDSSSDFQGMIVKEKNTNQITYTLRGTEGGESLGDLIADADLTFTGKATKQEQAMNSFYSKEREVA